MACVIIFVAFYPYIYPFSYILVFLIFYHHNYFKANETKTFSIIVR